jgi:hypothetical protein
MTGSTDKPEVGKGQPTEKWQENDKNFFLSEYHSTTDSSTQGNRSDGNNGGQVLKKNNIYPTK